MRTPTSLPSPFDSAPFGFRDARDSGLGAGRLRGADLSAPHRGVRVAVRPVTVEQRARAYQVGMGPDQFFSHLTAAELLRMRMPSRFLGSELHVTSVAPQRAPRGAGVIGHQVARPPVLLRQGALPLSHPLQALLECSTVLTVDELVVMGDGLLSRKNAVTSVGRLDTAIRFHEGRRGHVALVRARELLRPNTDSARETLLRLLLARAGFPEPEVNGAIRDASGRVIAHGDLVYREFRTVVEYDGGQHRTDDRQFSIDVQRIDEIVELDWRHIRVDKVLMAQPTTLVRKVGIALSRGGWRTTNWRLAR